jgi:hypothetical protein
VVSYLMVTRKRVVDYLEHCREPVSFNSIRYLGTDSPVVRWSSVVSIVSDLQDEGLVKVHIIRAGRKRAFMVVKL